jgi:MFS family permease
MGFSSIDAQDLSAPPSFLSFLTCIFTTWLADRTQQRGLMIITLSLIGATGYALLASVETVGVRYFGIFLATAGVFPSISNILPGVLNNQGSDTKRDTGIAILNIIGQCGPHLGTRVYPDDEGPRFINGQAIFAAFMFFNAFLALTLRTYLAWQNRKIEKLDAEMVREGKIRTTDGGLENEGYGFRDIL